MSVELDRRIAVLIMDEDPTDVGSYYPYSTDLSFALRAVRVVHETRIGFMLRLHHWPSRMQGFTPWKAEALPSDVDKPIYQGSGQTLPEAICNLLLALVQNDKRT